MSANCCSGRQGSDACTAAKGSCFISRMHAPCCISSGNDTSVGPLAAADRTATRRDMVAITLLAVARCNVRAL